MDDPRRPHFVRDMRTRLRMQIDRQPHFDLRYPHVADLEGALLITLDRLEEQDYAADPHGWCHERPVLLALVDAALAADPQPDEAGGEERERG